MGKGLEQFDGVGFIGSIITGVGRVVGGISETHENNKNRDKAISTGIDWYCDSMGKLRSTATGKLAFFEDGKLVEIESGKVCVDYIEIQREKFLRESRYSGKTVSYDIPYFISKYRRPPRNTIRLCVDITDKNLPYLREFIISIQQSEYNYERRKNETTILDTYKVYVDSKMRVIRDCDGFSNSISLPEIQKIIDEEIQKKYKYCQKSYSIDEYKRLFWETENGITIISFVKYDANKLLQMLKEKRR